MFRSHICTAVVLMAALGTHSSVSAQAGMEEADELFVLKACQQQTDATQRLACYDSAVARLTAATDSGELRLLDEAEVRTTRRGLFGFTLPKIGLFGSGSDGEEELTKLDSTVTAVRRVGRGEWHLTIEEGSVWSVRNPSRRFRPGVGDSIELERAALGSYWVRLNGKLGEKGRRVQ